MKSHDMYSDNDYGYIYVCPSNDIEGGHKVIKYLKKLPNGDGGSWTVVRHSEPIIVQESFFNTVNFKLNFDDEFNINELTKDVLKKNEHTKSLIKMCVDLETWFDDLMALRILGEYEDDVEQKS